jgi:YD repeat-containing protein
LNGDSKSTKGYLRSRGWKDLIFLLIVSTLAFFVSRLPSYRSDLEKWKARPKLAGGADSAKNNNAKIGKTGAVPCFFVVPSFSRDQPARSGSIGDCLMLVPDGRKLELFEVDLWNGELISLKTDLFIEDTIPVAFTRVGRILDDWSRRYQIFFRHVYDPYLFMDRNPYSSSQWMMPDNIHLHYRRISPGAGYSDAIFESNGLVPRFAGSRLAWNGDGWDLTLEDGTTYLSPEAYAAKRPQQGSLIGIFDGDGREVRLTRKRNGDLFEIESPNGRSMRFHYEGDKIDSIKSTTDQLVRYQYDSRDRLHKVQYSTNEEITYVYDDLNQVVEVDDASHGIILRCSYDSNGRVIEETTSQGIQYFLRYGPMQDGMNLWVEISCSQMELTRIDLNGTDYHVVRAVPSGR